MYGLASPRLASRTSFKTTAGCRWENAVCDGTAAVCGRVSIRGRVANSSIGGREFEWVVFCQPSGEARVAYIPRGESRRLTRLLTGRGRVPVCRKRNVRR